MGILTQRGKIGGLISKYLDFKRKFADMIDLVVYRNKEPTLELAILKTLIQRESSHQSILQPDVLNDELETGARVRDEAGIRRLAAALRMEDRGVQDQSASSVLRLQELENLGQEC